MGIRPLFRTPAKCIRKLRETTPYYGAGMLLYSRDSNGALHVLLGKRAHNPGKGTWSIPGGEVEGAESFWRTACREVSEEIGIPEERFCNGGEGTLPAVRLVMPRLFYWHTFLVPMAANISQFLLSHEFHECRWFPADALPKPLHCGTRRAVRRLKRLPT